MKSSIIRDGLFRVFEDGTIERKNKDGLYVIAAQNNMSRGGKYKVVSSCHGGKQKLHYVHRLVAEAFIPNPNNYPQVNHKDGNGHNNTLDNLEWCTPSQNVQHAFDTGLIDLKRFAVSCHLCGELTNSKQGICPNCRPEFERVSHLIERQNRMAAEMSLLSSVRLRPSSQKLIDLRKNGLTYEQIGSMCGVTKQCVQQTITRYLSKLTK